MEINEHTRLSDLLDRSPALAKVFKKHGLHCLSCRGIAEETVGKIAVNNGLSPGDLVRELNKAME